MFAEIVDLILHLLLPSSTELRLETITADDQTRCVTLELTSTQRTPACPLCQTPVRRIHSTYTRTLAALPWADVAVRLHLHVRKRSEEHTSELQSRQYLVCRLLLEKKKTLLCCNLNSTLHVSA